MAWKSSYFAPDTTQCLTEATALPVAFIVNNAVQLNFPPISSRTSHLSCYLAGHPRCLGLRDKAVACTVVLVSIFRKYFHVILKRASLPLKRHRLQAQELVFQ